MIFPFVITISDTFIDGNRRSLTLLPELSEERSEMPITLLLASEPPTVTRTEFIAPGITLRYRINVIDKDAYS